MFTFRASLVTTLNVGKMPVLCNKSKPNLESVNVTNTYLIGMLLSVYTCYLLFLQPHPLLMITATFNKYHPPYFVFCTCYIERYVTSLILAIHTIETLVKWNQKYTFHSSDSKLSYRLEYAVTVEYFSSSTAVKI